MTRRASVPLEAANGRIAELETTIAGLQTDVRALSELAPLVEEHAGALGDLEGDIEQAGRRIDALDETSETLSLDVETNQATAAVELTTLRSMELLSRARLFLYQANYGLAVADVAAAKAQIESLNNPDLAAVLTRLDSVLLNLPDRPVLASDDLDIAWQLLLE